MFLFSYFSAVKSNVCLHLADGWFVMIKPKHTHTSGYAANTFMLLIFCIMWAAVQTLKNEFYMLGQRKISKGDDLLKNTLF